MELELKAAVENLETMDRKKLEELKDRCGRQIIMWATSDPKKLSQNKQQIRWCETLVNHFGEKLLADISKD